MKAISLTQPWATLVAIGAKHFETRSWATAYRGPLAIHASAHMPDWAKASFYQDAHIREAMILNGSKRPADLPLGSIVAVCQLAGIHCVTAANVPPYPERAFGDYRPGRQAWELRHVIPLAVPFPCRGALGLWEWSDPSEIYFAEINELGMQIEEDTPEGLR